MHRVRARSTVLSCPWRASRHARSQVSSVRRQARAATVLCPVSAVCEPLRVL
jgi:hypothetical protein